MGTTAKQVVNLIIELQPGAYNEGIVLAIKAGFDPALMYEMLMTIRARCCIMEMKGPPVLRGDFTPFIALKLMSKDVGLACRRPKHLRCRCRGGPRRTKR